MRGTRAEPGQGPPQWGPPRDLPEGSTLAERSARAGIGAAAARDRTPGRHCWVIDPPGVPGRWPGLLVEWQPGHEPGSWRGLVFYSVVIREFPLVIQAWLDSSALESLPVR